MGVIWPAWEISQQSCVQFDGLQKSSQKMAQFRPPKLFPTLPPVTRIASDSDSSISSDFSCTKSAVFISRYSWGKGHLDQHPGFKKPSGMQGWLEDSTKGRTPTNCLEACPSSDMVWLYQWYIPTFWELRLAILAFQYDNFCFQLPPASQAH